MNQTQIIQSLQNDPTDENIRVAIDWLKKRKPTSKAALTVLAMLLETSQFEPELDWLTEWIHDGPWDSLILLSQKIYSIRIFDWFLTLLDRSPTHPQAQGLYSCLLMTYKSDELQNQATAWFVRYGLAQGATNVASVLLEETPTAEVIALANKLAARNPDNQMLASAMVKHVADKRSADRALRLLRTGDQSGIMLFAASLINISAAKYMPPVTECIRKYWNTEYVPGLIEQLVQSAPAAAPIMFQWIDEHPRRQETPDILKSTMLFTMSQPIVDYAWTWFLKHADNPNALPVLEYMLACTEPAKIPAAALQYCQDWIKVNETHSRWTAMVVRFLPQLKPDEQLSIGTRALAQVAANDQGRMLLELLRVGHDLTDQSLAWIEQNQTTPFASLVALELMELPPTPATIALAKKRVRRSGWVVDERYLNALVRARDAGAIEEARVLLRKPWLERRWGSLHRDRGDMLTALLTAISPDAELLAQAQHWLQRTPESWHQAHYDKVRAAYEKATQRAHNR